MGMKELNLGIIRETKDPPDRRVPLTPLQCSQLQRKYGGLKILVQPSENRCFSDQEYRAGGVVVTEDLSGCQVLMGVKEVKTGSLVGHRTYLFFSHTAKKQPYNRELLQAIVKKGIRLIDYEYLTDREQTRVVAFGRWAGVVGAYNGLRAYGSRSGKFGLAPASRCRDLSELKSGLRNLGLGSIRIAITGGGRVAGGAVEIMDAAGIRQVGPEAYLADSFRVPVFTRLDPWLYVRRKDRATFDFGHFVAHPDLYENSFLPYAARTDMYIACHFWDPRSPLLLTREDLAGGGIPISIIADISCDINGPIASTLRASTIAEPFYGYDPSTGLETMPFDPGSITVMAVDNLPGELPRDASTDFGEALMRHVLPEIMGVTDTGMLHRACIADKGKLTEPFAYLQSYLAGGD
jgi:saccharopine dehydrogenase (NAD+, L-lysine-forming)